MEQTHQTRAGRNKEEKSSPSRGGYPFWFSHRSFVLAPLVCLCVLLCGLLDYSTIGRGREGKGRDDGRVYIMFWSHIPHRFIFDFGVSLFIHVVCVIVGVITVVAHCGHDRCHCHRLVAVSAGLIELVGCGLCYCQSRWQVLLSMLFVIVCLILSVLVLLWNQSLKLSSSDHHQWSLLIVPKIWMDACITIFRFK